VTRRLGGVAQCCVRVAAEYIVDPKHIGQKQPIEPAALQRPGEIGPVWQPVIFRRAVARMGPEPRRLMRDAVHGEGVEPDLFFHDRKASRRALRGELSSAAVERRTVDGNWSMAAGFGKANRRPWSASSRGRMPIRWPKSNSILNPTRKIYEQSRCHRPGAPTSSFR